MLIGRFQGRAPEPVVAVRDMQREDAASFKGSCQSRQIMARDEIEIRVEIGNRYRSSSGGIAVLALQTLVVAAFALLGQRRIITALAFRWIRLVDL